MGSVKNEFREVSTCSTVFSPFMQLLWAAVWLQRTILASVEEGEGKWRRCSVGDFALSRCTILSMGFPARAATSFHTTAEPKQPRPASPKKKASLIIQQNSKLARCFCFCFIHKSHNESQSSQVEAESEEGEKKVFACRDLRLAISTTRARANKHERLPYQPTLFECIIVRQLTRPHESGMRLVSPDDACLCEHNMQCFTTMQLMQISSRGRNSKW
jgi:hypothetical protein